MINTFIDGFHTAVNDVAAVIVGVFDEFFHVAAETREIGGDGWDTADNTFGRSVAPWFVVGWKDAEMAASDKVVVIERQQRGIGVEKLELDLFL